jgi:Centromere DNA-binding protein complex CBF3 subunit, domain 2
MYYLKTGQLNGQSDCNAHPHGHIIKTYVKMLVQQGIVKDNKAFKDRGRNTISATITMHQFRSIIYYYWNLNTIYGLRHRADDLLRFSMMCRGQVTRRLMMSRLGLWSLDNLSQPNMFAMFATFNESKTNHFGHQEQAGCIRHKDPTMCPIGALALYLFARFHILNEEWPDMTRRERW